MPVGREEREARGVLIQQRRDEVRRGQPPVRAWVRLTS
jgi:hypothetical protein